MNAIGHTHVRASSERSVGTNGNLKWKILSKNAHRTLHYIQNWIETAGMQLP
jgi:hypothetical protein